MSDPFTDPVPPRGLPYWTRDGDQAAAEAHHRELWQKLYELTRAAGPGWGEVRGPEGPQPWR